LTEKYTQTLKLAVTHNYKTMRFPKTYTYNHIITKHYAFIAWLWGCIKIRSPTKNHISRGQRPRVICFSWVNKLSYLANIHTINCSLYGIKTRLHLTINLHVMIHRQHFYYHTKCSVIFIFGAINDHYVVCRSFEITKYLW
jgi:hypothetical protein